MDNRYVKTKAEWMAQLGEHTEYAEALRNYHVAGLTAHMSASEVLDIIVEWEGGIASGYGIRRLAKLILGSDPFGNY